MGADEKMKPSEMVITLAQTWLVMALLAFALYFVLVAIERRPQVLVEFRHGQNTTGHRVPIEPVEEAIEEKEVP